MRSAAGPGPVAGPDHDAARDARLADGGDAQALTGSSIGVAIIDSGIAPNADFAGRITAFYDFTNGQDGVAAAPYDDYGHGTHVAGLIGGSGVAVERRRSRASRRACGWSA